MLIHFLFFWRLYIPDKFAFSQYMQLPLKKKLHTVRRKIMPTIITQLQSNQIQTLERCMHSLCTPVVVQRELLRFRWESMSPLVFIPEIDYKLFLQACASACCYRLQTKMFCEALSCCLKVVELWDSRTCFLSISRTDKPMIRQGQGRLRCAVCRGNRLCIQMV